MGLGKTIQTIAFLEYLRVNQSIRGPFMVLAPLTTLSNWQREIEKWTTMNGNFHFKKCPSAKPTVIVFHGTKAARDMIKVHDWKVNGKKLIYKFDLILTTYDIIRW